MVTICVLALLSCPPWALPAEPPRLPWEDRADNRHARRRAKKVNR